MMATPSALEDWPSTMEEWQKNAPQISKLEFLIGKWELDRQQIEISATQQKELARQQYEQHKSQVQVVIDKAVANHTDQMKLDDLSEATRNFMAKVFAEERKNHDRLLRQLDEKYNAQLKALEAVCNESRRYQQETLRLTIDRLMKEHAAGQRRIIPSPELAPEPRLQAGPLGFVPQNGVPTNGVTTNGVTTNGITMNGVTGPPVPALGDRPQIMVDMRNVSSPSQQAAESNQLKRKPASDWERMRSEHQAKRVKPLAPPAPSQMLQSQAVKPLPPRTQQSEGSSSQAMGKAQNSSSEAGVSDQVLEQTITAQVPGPEQNLTQSSPELSLCSRTITFDEVYRDGEPDHYHKIAEYKGQYFILKCDEHKLHFGLNPLAGAAKHLAGKLHQLNKEHSVAIQQLGYHVVDATPEKVDMNNKAVEEAFRDGYKPRTMKMLSKAERRSMGLATRDSLPLKEKESEGGAAPKQLRSNAGINRPTPGQLYLGYWSSEKRNYVVVMLPWDTDGRWALKVAGLPGDLANCGLLKKPPRCFVVNESRTRIMGWAEGYEDNGPNEQKREFPVMYFDRSKTNRSVGWLHAKHLSPFDFNDPNKDSIPFFDEAVQHYQYFRDNPILEMDDSDDVPADAVLEDSGHVFQQAPDAPMIASSFYVPNPDEAMQDAPQVAHDGTESGHGSNIDRTESDDEMSMDTQESANSRRTSVSSHGRGVEVEKVVAILEKPTQAPMPASSALTKSRDGASGTTEDKDVSSAKSSTAVPSANASADRSVNLRRDSPGTMSKVPESRSDRRQETSSRQGSVTSANLGDNQAGNKLQDEQPADPAGSRASRVYSAAQQAPSQNADRDKEPVISNGSRASGVSSSTLPGPSGKANEQPKPALKGTVFLPSRLDGVAEDVRQAPTSKFDAPQDQISAVENRQPLQSITANQVGVQEQKQNAAVDNRQALQTISQNQSAPQAPNGRPQLQENRPSTEPGVWYSSLSAPVPGPSQKGQGTTAQGDPAQGGTRQVATGQVATGRGATGKGATGKGATGKGTTSPIEISTSKSKTQEESNPEKPWETAPVRPGWGSPPRPVFTGFPGENQTKPTEKISNPSAPPQPNPTSGINSHAPTASRRTSILGASSSPSPRAESPSQLKPTLGINSNDPLRRASGLGASSTPSPRAESPSKPKPTFGASVKREAGAMEQFELASYSDNKGQEFPSTGGGSLLRVVADTAASQLQVGSPVLQTFDVMKIKSLVVGPTFLEKCELGIETVDGNKATLVFCKSDVHKVAEVGRIQARRFCSWVKRFNKTVEYHNKSHDGGGR